ncbi:MAG: DUF2812 domain-containing protein [Oscillospiraceae bacterium]|nr:DUF2812 domain-containing protein [Oscillospiraceae bacterium]
MKKFMPLWFFDVTVTEKKLSELHSKGHHLSGFSPLSGMFEFSDGGNENVIYRICRLKGCNGTAPKGVTANGWESVCGTRNFYIAKNSDTETENIPSYKFWQTLNRVIIFIVLLIFCYFLGFLMGFGGGRIEHNGTVHDDMRFIFAAAVELILLVITLFLWKANKNLSKKGTDLGLSGFAKTIPGENLVYTKEEEKQMLKSGQMIKKAPLGWFYAPDKAEEMVERLAREGWKFYRFNEMGTVFYFIKSEPCKLKFVVDYQSEASDEYYLQSKDDGWKLEFTSMMRTMCFVVWSKEYTDSESEPEFYSDEANEMKLAKRMAFTLGIPMLVLGAAMLIFAIWITINKPKVAAILPAYALVFAEYTYFGSKATGFYLRTRKKHKLN